MANLKYSNVFIRATLKNQLKKNQIFLNKPLFAASRFYQKPAVLLAASRS
jgi:hypothetical protein